MSPILRSVLVLFLLANVLRGADGELEIRVVDEDTGQLVPVRMHLKDQRGRSVKPRRLISWGDHFLLPGGAVLKLRPGTYTFEMERGPEYHIRQGGFTIRQGDADNKVVRMKRFADLKKEGWWSGDLHVQRPLQDMPLLLEAEDLHIAPAIAWTDRQAPPENLDQQPLWQKSETARFFHRLSGLDRRNGGGLLYLQPPRSLPLQNSQAEYPSSCEFLVQANRTPETHIAAACPYAWDLPVWVASGMLDSVALAHGRLLRDGEPRHKKAVFPGDRPADKTLYPAPHGVGFWSQDIYYHLLNCGLRIAPSAGGGSGDSDNPVGYNRVYVQCGDKLDPATWWRNLKAGKVVVTNGPLIREPKVNDRPPGSVFIGEKGSPLELQATLNLSLREPVDYLEVVKNGEILHQVRLADWAKEGGRLPMVRFEKSGWMLVRAVTNHPKTYRFATTGPYYVEIDGKPRVSKASAQFFLDWVYQRAKRIQITDPQQKERVMRYHRAARDYWAKMVERANVK